MKKQPSSKKPTRKKTQPKRMEFHGIDTAGVLPNGGKYRLTIGVIEITISDA